METTQIWQEYERGVDYNRSKGLYVKSNRNHKFFYGEQWDGCNSGDIKPITLNVIKPIVKYKLGTIYQNSYAVVFNPNSGFSEIADMMRVQKLCDKLSENADRIWEAEQIDDKVRSIVKDSCIDAEGIVYSYFDLEKKKIRSEVIDKVNICYGDETNSNIQEQPYIIISFRQPVSRAKEEAKSNGISEEEIDLIVADNEVEEQAGYDGTNQEICDMCLVLLKLYKKNGTIHSKKCTKYATIQEDQNNHMTLYPVCHMIWEDRKGSARGNGEVEANIANQIEINKTATRRAISVKLGAYSKLAVNTKYIKNPDSLNKIGAVVKFDGGEVDDVRKAITYLTGTSMSADSKYLQDELIKYTQDLAGAGDNATGVANLSNTSGKAVLAIQQATQQPLNEQLNKFRTFLEDLARIYFDMWKTYMVNGMEILTKQKIQTQDEFGNIVEEELLVPESISIEELEQLEATIKIDITPKSPYDRFAVEQSLEQLLSANMITFEEYVEALPLDSVMDKTRLQMILKKREEEKKQIQAMQQQAQEQMQMIQNELQSREIKQNDIAGIAQMGNEVVNGMLNNLPPNSEEV